jgi:hypothetical protein
VPLSAVRRDRVTLPEVNALGDIETFAVVQLKVTLGYLENLVQFTGRDVSAWIVLSNLNHVARPAALARTRTLGKRLRRIMARISLFRHG